MSAEVVYLLLCFIIFRVKSRVHLVLIGWVEFARVANTLFVSTLTGYFTNTIHIPFFPTGLRSNS